MESISTDSVIINTEEVVCVVKENTKNDFLITFYFTTGKSYSLEYTTEEMRDNEFSKLREKL